LKRLLIADEISEEGVKLLVETMQVDYEPEITADKLLSIIADYDALLVRSRAKVTEDVIRAGKKLRVIGRAGVGVDNINVNVATECGIVVLNSPEGNTASAAEHTVALMMSLARHIPAADSSVKKGAWERKKYTGSELFNKTLAVIGMGKVGGRVVQTAQALGMKVIIYDPFITPERAAELKVQKVSLDELWTKADFITIHAPLTKETTKLINQSTLAKMKPGVKIINAARGGIIDETDLAEAIRSGQVGGAAIDVFENEPPANSPLLKLDSNIVLTPHLGASTHEAQFNVAIDLAEQIRDFLKTGIARNPVNLPSMRPEAVRELGKYIWLAEAMGTIACELSDGEASQLEVVAHGDLATKEVSPLVVAALRGLLSRRIDGVTYVNAHLVAKNHGIQVRTIKDENSDQFKEELSIIVSTETEKTTLSGTILTHDKPLITSINGHPINLYPAPMMLFTSHHDQPGVVAKVAGILSNHDINISNMSLARLLVRENAVMVMGVDDPISQPILSELVKWPGIHKAHFVSLQLLGNVSC
jgi:D-3-phosphoglycerate dehydrogenase / 2-oxoglutarate reductase